MLEQLQTTIDNLKNGDVEELATLITDAFSNISPLIAVISAAVCLLLAFFSYKIFKLCLVIGGAAGGYALGYMLIAPLLSTYLDFEYWGIICGIICAIICGVLAIVIYKLAIFASGAVCGYMVCWPVVTLILSDYAETFSDIGISCSTVAIIVAAILAFVIGIIVLMLFKPMFIIFTAIPCSISAMSTLVIGFFGLTAAPVISIIAVILGLIIGIFATIKQFKMNPGKKHKHSEKHKHSKKPAHSNTKQPQEQSR